MPLTSPRWKRPENVIARDIPRRGLLHIGRIARFRSAPKSDRLETGIGDRVRLESVIGLHRNTHGITRIVVTGASVSNPRWPSRGATRKLNETQAFHCPLKRGNSTLSIVASTGFAPAAPMGLHTPLHCRYWPPTCTASVCLCDSACVTPNDGEGAALPDRGLHLRMSPPRSGTRRRARPSVPGHRGWGPV